MAKGEGAASARYWKQCRQQYGLAKDDIVRVRFPADGEPVAGRVIGVLPGGCPKIGFSKPVAGMKFCYGSKNNLCQ